MKRSRCRVSSSDRRKNWRRPSIVRSGQAKRMVAVVYTFLYFFMVYETKYLDLISVPHRRPSRWPTPALGTLKALKNNVRLKFTPSSKSWVNLELFLISFQVSSTYTSCGIAMNSQWKTLSSTFKCTSYSASLLG